MSVSQTEFAAATLDPKQAVPEELVDARGRRAVGRFAVYRNNVTMALTGALEIAFPVIRNLVGDAFFRAVADVYLRSYPARSPLMMFYGDQMPVFLAGFEPTAGLSYLPDVARLEIARRDAGATGLRQCSGSLFLELRFDETGRWAPWGASPVVWCLRADISPLHGSGWE